MMKSVKQLFRRCALPIVFPIRSGPLKGCKWSAACGARFLRGSYCAREMRVYERYVKPGDTVFDIGAHVGYLSAVFTRLCAPGGRVFAFEPCPVNAAFIRHHIGINHLENVELIQAAVGEKNGLAGFDDAQGSGRGRVDPDGKVPVRMVSLDRLMADGELPAPSFIKMDIEGGEIGALTGGRGCIASSRPILFISTHGAKAHDFVMGFLADLGYRAELFPNSTNRVIGLP